MLTIVAVRGWTLRVSDANEPGVLFDYPLVRKCEVHIDGEPGRLSDLRNGDRVAISNPSRPGRKPNDKEGDGYGLVRATRASERQA